MSPDLDAWRTWVGRVEESRDTIDPLRARAMQAALDDPRAPLGPGDALPPLWHWLYFWTLAPEAELGPDGHAGRGGFLPPIDLPRRMWAGSRVSFPRPLPIGAAATRRSEIAGAFGELTRDQMIARLRRADIAYGAVNSVADLAAHPQLRRIEVETPSGPVALIAPPARHLGEARDYGPVPGLDQHGAAIRAEFAP